jgi:hypothetical protein
MATDRFRRTLASATLPTDDLEEPGRSLLPVQHWQAEDRRANPTGLRRRKVAVEINANPWRLDFDWRWHQRARELGCMFGFNPDAHDTSEIGLTHWGVAMARKGGVPRSGYSTVWACLSLQSGSAEGLCCLGDELGESG